MPRDWLHIFGFISLLTNFQEQLMRVILIVIQYSLNILSFMPFT